MESHTYLFLFVLQLVFTVVVLLALLHEKLSLIHISNELTFTQISKGDDIAIYRGTDTLEEPVAVVEAGATDIDYQTDGQYQLSAGAAKIAGVTGGSHGSVITLMGCSGVAPTVEKAVISF